MDGKRRRTRLKQGSPKKGSRCVVEDLQDIGRQLETVLNALNDAMPLSHEHILIVGASTSEVIGQHIGSAGTVEVASAIFGALKRFQSQTGVQLAFQCCEHLNRAIVVEKETAKENRLEQVTVVPVRSAGGAMAAYAYQKLDHPVVVEAIKGDCGIDIGDTFIGMHLKPVVVPVRCEVKEIGHAHVTIARTRPKLIGGERAVYPSRETVNHF
ncbi:TIGR01440 family protein [Pullulanibacillus sp. KACC 23026]|uniref:TIGR01440 family protein n=1 Tax=Pullulanibacillus sp. KACC 23026 TaxID=3028315 RepID=UPI0023AF3299|nr:TIGR01440 family protein [Pullulanibacillus sp. KACC 23026]WEG13104.1 TIGR01440 family protein [Pullulanibacillus sp. KACC 23026]